MHRADQFAARSRATAAQQVAAAVAAAYNLLAGAVGAQLSHKPLGAPA